MRKLLVGYGHRVLEEQSQIHNPDVHISKLIFVLSAHLLQDEEGLEG